MLKFDILALTYDKTANYHWPVIVERNQTGYVGSVTDTTADAPFGFGQAVNLVSGTQCVVKAAYQLPGDVCIQRFTKTNCKKGFSMSIWEKVQYGGEVLNVRKQHQKKYIFSTGKWHIYYKFHSAMIIINFSGGDHVGDKSYPGVALYHEGINLVAVVSTGDDVWHLNVTGQLINSTWHNIGIRWKPNPSGSVKDGGLEVHKLKLM